VRGFLFIVLFLSGCVTQKNEQKFNKNWKQIYAQELKIALENDDNEAFMFFWPEYLKEINKDKNE